MDLLSQVEHSLNKELALLIETLQLAQQPSAPTTSPPATTTTQQQQPAGAALANDAATPSNRNYTNTAVTEMTHQLLSQVVRTDLYLSHLPADTEIDLQSATTQLQQIKELDQQLREARTTYAATRVQCEELRSELSKELEIQAERALNEKLEFDL